MSKLLSFIVPVYEPDLHQFEKCVRSLCDQSLKTWDAIFVLDGPNKAAREIIAKILGSADNCLVVEQEHSGVQRARNHGGSLAKGDYLVFWDCDCVIEPDAAKTWLEMFDRNPDIGFVYSGYRFEEGAGAINSEAFDPFTLRVRNYISTCFPLRREFYPGWNESLKSLQDWDYWLSAVEKGAKGKFLQGYAFQTLSPAPKSISGIGCANDVWLERVDAVKKAHNLPERDICVSSLGNKGEGIALAKLIDADYQDIPNYKPHRYKTVIQIGFSFTPGRVEHHSSIFNEKHVKKILFWTCDDITQVYNALSLNAIHKYSILLNSVCAHQYVEDKAAYDMMTKAGFTVDVMPVPMAGDALPLPERRKFAVDCHENYSHIFNVVSRSLPDVELVNMRGQHAMTEFSGIVHFHPDKTLSATLKKAAIAGRHIISNVQAPFMGYIDEDRTVDKFIPAIVEKIRELAYSAPKDSARNFYLKQLGPEKLKEVALAN